MKAPNGGDEDGGLRSVLHQNAESILIARQRAERELEQAKQALETRTAELAESLALMHATLESTADGILVTDHAGRVTGFNERALWMWGLTRDVVSTDAPGGPFEAMSRQGADPAKLLNEVAEILRTAPGESFHVLELADGRVFERYTRVQKIGDRVIGRVWSYRDVTERARTEAALREAKAQAEAASRAKSTFLAMMSHELRTPLNAIAGYAELMQLGIHGPVTPEQMHALTRIQASQRHLLSLIDEVLTHAKLETGTVTFEFARVSVQEAIRGAEELITPQAWTSGVTVAVRHMSPDLCVHADAERLQQILLNLLSNAVKFTPRGGRVEIEGRPVDGSVHIAVRDTGIGIPGDMLERIFEPFVQVRSELTRDAAGTGLGLAISRTLARGMDGDLTVESEPGKGSTFTVILPASSADDAPSSRDVDHLPLTNARRP